MNPLHGQGLSLFQEEMKPIQYILTDEMNFIEPKLFVQIESCLRELFLETNDHSFDNWSIILIGHLGQLPPVMDRQDMQEKLWKSVYGKTLPL